MRLAASAPGPVLQVRLASTGLPSAGSPGRDTGNHWPQHQSYAGEKHVPSPPAPVRGGGVCLHGGGREDGREGVLDFAEHDLDVRVLRAERRADVDERLVGVGQARSAWKSDESQREGTHKLMPETVELVRDGEEAARELAPQGREGEG